MTARDSMLSSAAPIAAGEILVVADDATRKVVTNHVSMLAMQTSSADSADTAIAVATDKAAMLDCVLIDISLGLDAWEIIRRLRQSAETSTIPMVMIMAHQPTEADTLKLIEAGVIDHIVKPLSGALLCAKVRAIADRSRIQRELKSKLKVAIEYSAHDPLTSLYNRRYFERRLREESAHAKRHKRPFSLIIIDLDHFKLVNDTYGHEEGDKVLKHVAELVTASLREDDIACRFGGEEFVLLLRATPGSSARVVANRLRASVAGKSIELGGQDRHVTFSGGVAAADDRNNYNCEGILDRADKALYRAKRSGRNRVEME